MAVAVTMAVAMAVVVVTCGWRRVFGWLIMCMRVGRAVLAGGPRFAGAFVSAVGVAMMMMAVIMMLVSVAMRMAAGMLFLSSVSVGVRVRVRVVAFFVFFSFGCRPVAVAVAVACHTRRNERDIVEHEQNAHNQKEGNEGQKRAGRGKELCDSATPR